MANIQPEIYEEVTM